MKDLEYKLIRSRRKTISMEVNRDGILVRAPLRMTDSQISNFVFQHRNWAEKRLSELEEKNRRLADIPELTDEDIKLLTKKAQEVIPERARYYAPKLGVTYDRFTIRHQRTRWGE